MAWYMNINEDAKVGFLLALTEKMIDQVTEGYNDARKGIDKCWKWVEEKKYDGVDLYLIFDNEEDGGLSMFYEEAVDNENHQQASIWLCINYALVYTIWQAYKFEYGNDEHVPQSIEIVDDEMIDAFTQEIKKVDRYQEEWAEGLKQYLLKNFPAGCDKKIRKEEMIRLI
ncbi:Imm6 family immunity protein [Thermoactinomyces sp. CICC 10522]|jgi:Immunity protein Imm6|uniref:Imm6 family immunity protein n=1 Tax=Thermoactinomyces sp. CICC 10522 TaxID=2767427 RepID=UPI0018DB2380|nr:Imm6 family immunity protein [Thermoactinomyces sp. CICC 10522]MBH8605822.1 hypothetical protein [Thermoactinomyces sp. CICC 10522]